MFERCHSIFGFIRKSFRSHLLFHEFLFKQAHVCILDCLKNGDWEPLLCNSGVKSDGEPIACLPQIAKCVSDPNGGKCLDRNPVRAKRG